MKATDMPAQCAHAYQDIRDAVRALCAEFPAEYHRKIDEARGYPEAFVDALTKAGWMAALGSPSTDNPDGLTGNRTQRELQRILHGAAHGLALPAMKGSSAILQPDGNPVGRHPLPQENRND